MTDPSLDRPRVSRTGVILAAGFGSRLRQGDPGGLKPLTAVGGTPLLVRSLDTLEDAGCERVVIVVGFSGERIQNELRNAYGGRLEVVFVHNSQYELANGVSALAARPHVHGQFVLAMADHVFDARFVAVARNHVPPAGGASLLIDRKLDTVFDMDDATKVRTDGRQEIVAIGKSLETYDAVDTGMFVGTTGLFDVLQAVYDEQGDVSMSDAMTRLAHAGLARAVDVGAGMWQDVDTPEMLAHAERILASEQTST